MDNEKNEDIKTETPQEENKNEAPQEPSQIDKELEKVKQRGEGRTELEKLLYTEKKLKERKAKLLEEQGVENPVPLEDNEPLTVSKWKELEAEKAQKTALQMADDIADDKEKELTKHYLQERIVPSGNPIEDLKFARAAVNSLKNAQIVEEIQRKGNPKTYSSAGADGKYQVTFEPTPEEAQFMKPPFNMSEADILKARRLNEAKQKSIV